MNAIQKILEEIRDVCDGKQDVSWDGDAPNDYMRIDMLVGEALTALRGIAAVDVDEITRNVMKVFDEYKYGDSSRPHSFYDEKKPTLVWLIEHLHASGYLGRLPEIEGLEEALKEPLYHSSKADCLKVRPQIIEAAKEYARRSK